MTAALDRFTRRLDALRLRTTGVLLGTFDRLGSYDYAAGDRFHAAAAPVVTAAATTAGAMTAGYLTVTSGAVTPVDSTAVAANLTAHLYDPFDIIGARLSDGMPWTEAVEAARANVEALATDATHGVARHSMAQAGPRTRYVRRLTGTTTCQWCMSLSGVIFDDAISADFGHLRCDCVPFPVTDDLVAHNETIRNEAGFDASAQELWGKRQQRRNLSNQIDNAKARQADAAEQLRTEQDPARRERLSIREQEWETRAEFAAERLRLLETGSRLPA